VTAEILQLWAERSPGLRVVATIPTTKYTKWQAARRELADAFGKPVRLERLATPDEVRRAEDTYPGVDFSEGIAAAFSGLPVAEVSMDDWVRGVSARARRW
jgi:hypothetical protein